MCKILKIKYFPNSPLLTRIPFSVGYNTQINNTIMSSNAIIGPPVPAVGEWGIIALALFLVIFGIVAVREQVWSSESKG